MTGTAFPSLAGVLLVVVAFVAALEVLARLPGERARRGAVAALTVAGMAWLDPASLAVLTVLSTAVYAVCRQGVRLKGRLLGVVVGGLILLVLFKDLGRLLAFEQRWIPLGVSYYFFRLIALLVDHARGKSKVADATPLEFYSWVFFAPILLAGPILRFGDFRVRPDALEREVRLGLYGRLAVAAFAKLFVVDQLLGPLTYDQLLPALRDLVMQPATASTRALGAGFGVASWLHAYLDLMLYTELSIAVAGLLGFTSVENFQRPLLATNLSQFWQRYHMSLSSWTRDYVFFPTLLRFRKTWLASLLTMLVMGLWHATTPAWVCWALLHASNLIAYQAWKGSRPYKWLAGRRFGGATLRWGGRLLTIGFVAQVFTLVAVHDFDLAVRILFHAFAP